MSMIRLPPGMTPEEYFASPEGQRAEEAGANLARRNAPAQGNSRPQPFRPGAAQSRQDPYASSTKSQGVNDVAAEIEAALSEMAPDMDRSQRSVLAAQLAREYTQARRSAVKAMASPPAPPTMGPQQVWDGNKFVDTGTPAYREAVDSRQAQRTVADDERARNVERVRMQQAKARQGMALEAERQKKRKTGVTGPLMRQARQDDMLARERASQFDLYAQGKSKVAPPGMAQPAQPAGQGTPYQAPDAQAMYWEMVQRGAEPAVASARVRRAFQNAPR